MLPSLMAGGGRAGAGDPRRKGKPEPRGPQTVPWQMWVLWLVLNAYLYWRTSAPARSLLPRGDRVRLGEDAVAWKSPGGDVELLLPPAASRLAESAWVLAVHNAFRGELVHLHAGFHLSLHPLRQTPLVQITRQAAGASAGGAVHVMIKSHKKRLTRNTFVRCHLLRMSSCLHLSPV